TQLTYNSSNEVTEVIDPEGRSTTYTYDSDGNLISVANAAGTTAYTYANPGNHEVTEIAYPNGTHEFFTYDSSGRLSEQYGDSQTDDIKYAYDQYGNITETDSQGDITYITRGNAGETISIMNPLGNVFSNTYSANDTPTTTTDAQGQTSETVYGFNGQIMSITGADGDETSFGYNSFSEPVLITDPNDNPTRQAYNSDGDLTSVTDANHQTSTYTYTSTGELASSNSAGGHIVNNHYNSLGQLVSQTFSDGSTDSYTYDTHGNVLTATDSTFGTETFTYDSADRLTKVTYPNGLSLTYTYNSNGQFASMVDQTGFATNYAYNGQGLLLKVTDGSGNTVATYIYDALNRLTLIEYGNGTSTQYAYDKASEVTSVTNYLAGGTIASSFAYTYTEDGQIASETTQAGTTTYVYDADNQLVQTVLPGGETITYNYDLAGNRISVVDSVNGTTDYTTNNLNQYTNSTGTTYTYDLDGNLISQTGTGGTTTYTYNALNELKTMTVNGVTTTYTYDAMGNRVASTTSGVTTYNLVSPTSSSLIGQFTSNGTVIAQYTYGTGLTSQVDSSGNVSYFNFDATGNTADLTNGSGAVTNTYTYDPFGQQLSSTVTTANIFTYSGQNGVMSVGNNNYLTRTRLYDATLGRFTQRDPLGFNGGDANLYRYANNNPGNYNDPSGEIIGLPLDPFGFNASIIQSILTNAYNFATAEAGEAAAVETGALGANASGIFSDTGVLLGSSAGVGSPGLGTLSNAALEEAGFTNLGGPAVFSTPLEFTVTFSNSPVVATTTRAVTLTTEGAAAAGTGLVLAAPSLVYGALKYNLEYNKEFPDGTPVPTQDVLNYNDIYRRILRDPLGAQLLKNYMDGGDPVSQDDLTTILQVIAKEKRLASTQAVTSGDPNEIIGPAGYGSDNFIAADTLLPYQIDFTNDPTASAPAQVVTVTQQLSSALDWSTFQFGTIGFGSTTINVPAGLQSYMTTVNLSNTLAVEVAASFDNSTGIATWTFTSIDPSTGDVPSDPLSGFLPADVTPPQGEGFVNYTIQPSSSATTGTVISAQATVVFDNNPAINTETVTNTLDAVAPTSSISALPAMATSTYFNLTWSGSDDTGGSGLAYYNIYVSEDGGDYTPFLSNTTATSAQFIGDPGHSYSFYSIATDNAGNEQLVPGSAQASTTIPAIARTITFGGKTKATYTDSQGHMVTITLSSGTGTLSFLSNGNADPISLILSNTTAKSTLTVKVSGGIATLGTVTVNGSLNSFNAPDANFTVAFTITGTINSLKLGDETLTPSTLYIEGNGTTTIILGKAQGLTITDAGTIKSLSATSWSGGASGTDVITASNLQKLSVKGAFDANVTTTTGSLSVALGSVVAGTWTIGGSIKSLVVGASIANSNIDVSGNIGKIAVGGMSNSSIFAGVSAGTTGLPVTADFASASSILSFSDKGSSPFVNSDIAAATIDTVALANVTTNNNGTPFGIAAKSLKSFGLRQSKQKPITWHTGQSSTIFNTLPGDLRVELL
ncbi:MAG TPA: RHS repeat-associated core domain-containing protein, partial [Tepidisphaeraceae bacterium]